MKKIEKALKAYLGNNIDDESGIEIYFSVFERIKNGESYLTGNDYHYAYHLYDFGFLKRLSCPIWKDGVFKGRDITFYMPDGDI